MALPCNELIDEIQARCGRPDAVADELIDVTWCTRRINEGQKEIARKVMLIPSLTFSNKVAHDTTGTIQYALSDISCGDSTTLNSVNRITDAWYLDGNNTRHLTFQPLDVFDSEHPDPTHSDEHFYKPEFWTQRSNQYVLMYPYCASAYWDKDLRFDGDFWPADFSTDSTEASDISQADEGLILYGLWKAWGAIGDTAEEAKAKKRWSNPEPLPGETIGWLESFRDDVELLAPWGQNLYEMYGG